MSRVSVCIPVYNGGKYLNEAINSLLNQTYEDFEIILVDDSSTDNSIEIIQSYKDKRIHLYKNEKNQGIAYTRNRAIDLANSEYIALLDDDDIAVPYRLEHEVKFLDDNKDIDVVGGHLRRIDKNGNDLNSQWNVYLNPNYIKAYLMLGDTIANGTVMFRKKFVNDHNIRFKDNMYGAEDYMFWVECSLKGKITNLDEVLLLWRVGHGNETQNVFNNKLVERNKVIDDIHTYALYENGFRLNQNELTILNKVFREEGTIDNQQEMEQLFNTLKNIARQASNYKLDNEKEIITMCRKRFGEKVGKAFYLW